MKLALIGHPISHSKSPSLFKELRPQWTFDLIETPDFHQAISIFKASYDGICVTAPFKELAFDTADKHDDLCTAVGATNLLVKEQGIIKAYNTDVYGVMECLKICNLESAKVLIVGCGGAGKAAAIASLDMGVPTSMINRDYSKSIDLKGRYPEINIFEISALVSAVEKNDIIIYTLPIQIPGLSQIDFSSKTIIEANYRSAFLSECPSKQYIKGEIWLAKQAQAAADIISRITKTMGG